MAAAQRAPITVKFPPGASNSSACFTCPLFGNKTGKEMVRLNVTRHLGVMVECYVLLDGNMQTVYRFTLQ